MHRVLCSYLAISLVAFSLATPTLADPCGPALSPVAQAQASDEQRLRLELLSFGISEKDISFLARYPSVRMASDIEVAVPQKNSGTDLGRLPLIAELYDMKQIQAAVLRQGSISASQAEDFGSCLDDLPGEGWNQLPFIEKLKRVDVESLNAKRKAKFLYGIASVWPALAVPKQIPEAAFLNDFALKVERPSIFSRTGDGETRELISVSKFERTNANELPKGSRLTNPCVEFVHRDGLLLSPLAYLRSMLGFAKGAGSLEDLLEANDLSAHLHFSNGNKNLTPIMARFKRWYLLLDAQDGRLDRGLFTHYQLDGQMNQRGSLRAMNNAHWELRVHYLDFVAELSHIAWLSSVEEPKAIEFLDAKIRRDLTPETVELLYRTNKAILVEFAEYLDSTHLDPARLAEIKNMAASRKIVDHVGIGPAGWNPYRFERRVGRRRW
jgi:hypothetical protein